MLIQLDLPTFERPTKAISGTSILGKNCKVGAVVKNFAVCNQETATLLSGKAARAALELALVDASALFECWLDASWEVGVGLGVCTATFGMNWSDYGSRLKSKTHISEVTTGLYQHQRLIRNFDRCRTYSWSACRQIG